jgi:hypothetical protein
MAVTVWQDAEHVGDPTKGWVLDYSDRERLVLGGALGSSHPFVAMSFEATLLDLAVWEWAE